MSVAETIQAPYAPAETLAPAELVEKADHSKLTRWDRELLAKGGHLETVIQQGHLVEVHETNNLFRNITTLMLPEGDPYRQAFEPFYAQIKLKELVKGVQNMDPNLVAKVLHFAKKGASNTVELNQHKPGTPEYKSLQARQLQASETEMPAVKVTYSRFYEDLVDVAPAIFEKPEDAQMALDSLV